MSAPRAEQNLHRVLKMRAAGRERRREPAGYMRTESEDRGFYRGGRKASWHRARWLPYWTTLVHRPITQAALIDWPAPGVLPSSAKSAWKQPRAPHEKHAR